MRTILLLILAAALAPGQRKPAPRAHPDIGGANGECIECHRGFSSEIVADWERSKHGSRQVPCVTCHNAVGANFLRKPGAEKCVACHAQQVEDLRQTAMRGKDCFSCHTPHGLNPHRSLWHPQVKSEGGTER
ncbi:MAG: cytochrome c3 family protein [Bryobacteraceae bacterium]